MFSARGVRAVGVDEVIERAGVAKATLYRHFPSKDDLVVAFLEEREQRWTVDWVEAEARGRGSEPAQQLLAIFDLFDEWFHRDDFEGCSFINVLVETPDPTSPVHEATAGHLQEIRGFLADLAAEAAIEKPEEFARRWHILMKGSIVQAGEGDRQAARRAQAMGRRLIDEYR